MSSQTDIIEVALTTRTLAQAQELQELIASDVGGRYERPVTDTWNNLGSMSSTGSFDHKVLENVTNMQDAVIERLAKARYRDLSQVPFTSPHEASRALLVHLPYDQVAQLVRVDFHESDPPTRTSKRITPVFRDLGCGIEPGYASSSIFALGSPHKSQRYWLQGAFGYGAKSTFRNARAVVLVSRRAPEFEPAEDLITVAVVLWQSFGKGLAAYYLTTTDWRDGDDRSAEPWSAPASAYPDFEPGTHLALISYGVEGFHRKEADQRGFDRVLDTRLYEPVTPVRFANHVITEAHPKNLRGLRRQLQENLRSDRREQTATLPYRIRGNTYHLPVTAYVFMGRAGQTGARRNFVAHDHAVVFTSSGQVHHHWRPSELASRINLPRLQDRLFAVVETDELPIELRTELFPATRTGIVPHDDALRLEQQVAALLDGWDFLRDINSELIREALTARNNGRPTLQVAKQISRALRVRGYSLGATRNGNGSARGPRPRRPIDLYPEPTILEGPLQVQAELGTIKSIRYVVNARDEFLNKGRGQLLVTCCDHPDIGEREITVGQLHNGTARVMVAIPDEAVIGTFTIKAEIDSWQRHRGGFGGHLEWTTELELVEERESARSREPRPPKGRSADEGTDVALIWDGCDHDGWNASVPGSFERIPAKDLAAHDEYQELAALGEALVPTIVLNEDYAPLRKYIAGRQKALVSAGGADRVRDRYAVGAGVGLALLDQEAAKLAKAGTRFDDDVLLASKRAAAQAALSVLPEFDALAREAGLDV